jgi:hypothetical protein
MILDLLMFLYLGVPMLAVLVYGHVMYNSTENQRRLALCHQGYRIIAIRGTAATLKAQHIEQRTVRALGES